MVCASPLKKLTFVYKPKLVKTLIGGGTGNAVPKKKVTFIRCSNPMGYAHPSTRTEKSMGYN